MQRLLELPLALDPPEQSWRDWLLMITLVVFVLVEGILRPDVPWRPVVIGIAIVAPLVILRARAYPLAATIADELHVSLSTVKTHLTSLMTKLDARNGVGLATCAHESGRA